MPLPSRTAASLVGGVVAALLCVPGSAGAVQVCEQVPAPDGAVQDVPWAQAGYDPQTRLWPFSRGAGVLVAVLDTGVDATHPQLAGRVAEGVDLVRAQPGAGVDCVPHGTGLAGIVVAQPASTTGLVGLAPDATVLPVQVTDEPVLAAGGDEPVSPDVVAAGIEAALDAGAAVVDVGVVASSDSPALEAAVQRALAAGVLVVAPVGDGHVPDRDDPGPTDPALTAWPAAHPGVLGVGAATRAGGRVPSSQVGDDVDLLAPGEDVVSTGVGGQRVYDGTSVATAFVAATAALLLALPDTDRAQPLPAGGPERVAALTDRLLGTATGGQDSPRYGAGVLDPVRALTESLSSTAPVAAGAYTGPEADPAAEAAARERASSARTAGLVAAALGGVVGLGLLGGVLVPRARRRGWRAGVQRPDTRPDDPPEFLAGDALYRGLDRR